MSSITKNNIAFKVELKRKEGESTFHRFSGAYNFSELSTVVSHLWGERPKHLVLDYTDDEGDLVRFTSDSEWEECVRIHLASGAAVLRLTGKKMKEPKEKKSKQADAAPSPVSDSESEQADAPVAPQEPAASQTTRQAGAASTNARTGSWVSSVPILPEIVQTLQQPLNMEPLSKAASDFVQATMFPTPAATPTGSVPASKASRHADPAPLNQKIQAAIYDASENVTDLMSRVYNCDANTQLLQGATEMFGSAVKRLVNPFTPSEVHLDIDRTKLYRDAVAKGNELIEAFQLSKAEALLKSAIGVFPANALLEYNLACVRSLEGTAKSIEEALSLLLQAKVHGYNDLNQMRTDADLANVRNHPRFASEVLGEEEKPKTPVAPAPVAQPEPRHCGHSWCTLTDKRDCCACSDLRPTNEGTKIWKDGVGAMTVPIRHLHYCPGCRTQAERSTPATSASSELGRKVLTLLAIFPTMTLDAAHVALRHANGNLDRAVNARLAYDF